MSILVAYASKHGSTAEIAERIAECLRESGLDADARPVREAGDLDDYQGFVVGSAAYLGSWLNDATAFVRGNRKLLAQWPVWLFSSGPLDSEATEARRLDSLMAAEPQELPDFEESIHPRQHRVFLGALDPSKLNYAERSLRKLPAGRALLPEGDFREWDEIHEWAYQIAQEMTRLEAGPVKKVPR
jgi:menaquinone-dependent protoporphyrinogen oxidase